MYQTADLAQQAGVQSAAIMLSCQYAEGRVSCNLGL